MKQISTPHVIWLSLVLVHDNTVQQVYDESKKFQLFQITISPTPTLFYLIGGCSRVYLFGDRYRVGVYGVRDSDRQ